MAYGGPKVVEVEEACPTCGDNKARAWSDDLSDVSECVECELDYMETERLLDDRLERYWEDRGGFRSI